MAVHPSTVNTIGKQLLPKTFGQSNVNIAQQVVRGRVGRSQEVEMGPGAEGWARRPPSTTTLFLRLAREWRFCMSWPVP